MATPIKIIIDNVLLACHTLLELPLCLSASFIARGVLFPPLRWATASISDFQVGSPYVVVHCTAVLAIET